jgi:hypothetical protein
MGKYITAWALNCSPSFNGGIRLTLWFLGDNHLPPQSELLVAREAENLSFLLSFPLEKPHFSNLDYIFVYTSFEITHEFYRLRLGVPVRHRN